MKKNIIFGIALILFTGLVLSSCSSPSIDPTEAEALPITPSTEADLPTEAATEAIEEAVATQASPEDAAQPATEAAEEPATITHQDVPGEPVYTQSLPGECNTGYNYDNPGFAVKEPCDSWSINLLERPVSADLSEFYHYLDILDAKAGGDNEWIFFQIDLFGAGSPDGAEPVIYYIELDNVQNGRGNFLVSVTNQDLYETAWSVAGVQVYEDQNEDVGGDIAIRPDGSYEGNGYDTLLFDAGQGADPDLAWARRDPSHVNQIEFAVKSSLLGENKSFMWWAGAVQGEFNAQSFDFVDSTSETELFPIDTTCGWIMGTEMNYNIRKCYIAPEPTEGPTNSSAPTPPDEDICVQPPHPDPENNCWIWFEDQCEWVCFN